MVNLRFYDHISLRAEAFFSLGWARCWGLERVRKIKHDMQIPIALQSSTGICVETFPYFFLCKQESCDFFFSNRYEFSHASPSRISTNTFAPRQFEDVYKVRSYGSHRGGALKKNGENFQCPPSATPPRK